MAIQDDWSIDYSLKTVKHTSGTTVYTVNALYSWLMDTFDELTTLDDDPPMSAQTPTDYRLINGWFIDKPSFQYLSGGSVATLGWDAATYAYGIYTLTFGSSGYTSAISGDIGKTVVSSSGSTGVLLAYDNTLRKWWVRESSGSTWSNTNTVTITSGTGAGTLNASGGTGESLFANIFSLGTIESGTQIYAEQNGSVLTTYWSTGHVDLVLQVKENGSLINSGKIRLFAREWTDKYSHYEADLSGAGRTPAPLATENDLDNQTSSSTVAGWTDVTVTFGTVSRDLDNGNGSKNYDVEIDCGSRASLAEVYERLKYVTRRGETSTLNGVAGQIYRSANSSYTEVTASPFGTFAGGVFFGARGVWLKNVPAADIKDYQLIAADGTTQIPPNQVSVTVSSVIAGDRVAVFKTSSGSIIKNQYTLTTGNNAAGTSLVMSASIASDTPKSSGGVVRIVVSSNVEHRYEYTTYATATFTLKTIPNATITTGNSAGTTLTASAATFVTSGVTAGMMIRNSTDGSTAYVVSVDSETQLTTTALSGGSDNRYDVSDSITINKLVQNYSSGLNVYVPLIDKVATTTSASNSLVYSSDIPVLVRVRNSTTSGNKIVPFETTGTVTSTGLTVSAIRTADTIIS